MAGSAHPLTAPTTRTQIRLVRLDSTKISHISPWQRQRHCVKAHSPTFLPRNDDQTALLSRPVSGTLPGDRGRQLGACGLVRRADSRSAHNSANNVWLGWKRFAPFSQWEEQNRRTHRVRHCGLNTPPTHYTLHTTQYTKSQENNSPYTQPNQAINRSNKKSLIALQFKAAAFIRGIKNFIGWWVSV